MSIFPPPRVELGDCQDCHLLKYCNVQKHGSRFTLKLGICRKYALYPKKNASNKSCSALNSVQKSQLGARMSVSTRVAIAIFWNIMSKNGGSAGCFEINASDYPKIRRKNLETIGLPLATGYNCRIASVAALKGDAQYFIIWNIGDHCLNFSINMIRFEKVGG